MSLNLKATATIFINGPALCREKDGLWEVLFLHPEEKEHKLNIWVNELNLSTGSEELYTDFDSQEIMSGKITLTAKGAVKPGTPTYTNNNFRDDRDFCWMVDLNKLHGKFNMIEGLHEKTSYLSIADAILYTADISKNRYNIEQPSRPAEETGGIRETRRIGDTIGADIECQTGGEIIINIEKRDKSNKQFRLPQKSGFKYNIFMDNDCHNDIGGDFKYYYNYIDPNGDYPYRVTKIPMKIITDEAACNAVPGNPDCDFANYFQTGRCNPLSEDQ